MANRISQVLIGVFLVSLLLSSVALAGGGGSQRCASPNAPIPDFASPNPGTVSSEIYFSADLGTLLDLSVSLQINHTWVADLRVTLTHVDSGKSVVLVNRVPCTTDNYSLVLSDLASSPLQTAACGTTTFPTGAYQPAQAINPVFDGESLYGIYRLTVEDLVSGDTGTLVSWCLNWPNTSLGAESVSSRSTAAAGETYSYSFLVRNSGSIPASNVTLVAILPPSLSFVSGTIGSSPILPSDSYSGLPAGVQDDLNALESTPVEVRVKPVNPPPAMPLVLVQTPASIAGEITAGDASFGGNLSLNPIQGALAQAIGGASGSKVCEALTNPAEVSGKIALVDRGVCPFAMKAKNVQNAGGIGVIVVNNTDDVTGIAGADPSVSIPALMVGNSDGALLKSELGSGVSVRMFIGAPVVRWRVFPYFKIANDRAGTTVLTPLTVQAATTILADTDDDGVDDTMDLCNLDPNKTTPGVCGCGVSDSDSDGDLVPDCNDACPLDAAKTGPGLCGCGLVDADQDADGTPDCSDLCPNDRAKVALGFCGCGVPDLDKNGNRIPDCLYTEELKDRSAQIASLLPKVKPAKTKIQKRDVAANVRLIKGYLAEIQAIVAQRGALIVSKSGHLSADTAALLKKVKSVFQVSSKKYALNMKAAKKALAAYRASLA